MLFTYFAVLGLHCCVQAFSLVSEAGAGRGWFSTSTCASPSVAISSEHRLQQLRLVGSRRRCNVMVHKSVFICAGCCAVSLLLRGPFSRFRLPQCTGSVAGAGAPAAVATGSA